MRAPSHIHHGVLQGSKGQSALARLGYQRCAHFSDDFGRHADYRCDRHFHCGTVVLIPAGGNPAYSDPNEFLMAAINQETRRDAQEGRTVDFALPRGIPEGLELSVGAWVLAPLVDQGMTIEVDAERPPASDGLPHPHIHAYVAQRELTGEGFGLKRREWNNFFLRGRGRHVRFLIASRITAACYLLGVLVHVDPRKKTFWSADLPEERISHKLWRGHARGNRVEPIEELKDRRASRVEAPRAQAAPGMSFRARLIIYSPADYHVGVRQRADRIDQFCAAFRSLGFDPVEYSVDGVDMCCVMTAGGELFFDGEALTAYRLRDVGGLAGAIVDFARSLEWPALVAEGDDDFCDALAVSGAAHGLVPINRSVGPVALARIADPTGQSLLAKITPFDRLGAAVEQIQRRANAEAEERAVLPAATALNAANNDFPGAPGPLPMLEPLTAVADCDPSALNRDDSGAEQRLQPDDDPLEEFLRFVDALYGSGADARLAHEQLQSTTQDIGACGADIEDFPAPGSRQSRNNSVAPTPKQDEAVGPTAQLSDDDPLAELLALIDTGLSTASPKTSGFMTNEDISEAPPTHDAGREAFSNSAFEDFPTPQWGIDYVEPTSSPRRQDLGAVLNQASPAEEEDQDYRNSS